jgi:hypothetical protein
MRSVFGANGADIVQVSGLWAQTTRDVNSRCSELALAECNKDAQRVFTHCAARAGSGVRVGKDEWMQHRRGVVIQIQRVCR